MFNIFDTTISRARKGMFLHNHATQKDKLWFDSDNEEEYNKNLLRQPRDWYYRTNHIEYTVNKHGYRTKEFDSIDWANSVVMFGCSVTFGNGLDDKHTISSQLEQLLNMPVINMGVSGSSMLFNHHNNIILREHYPTPKAIVMYWPGHDRIAHYSKHKIVHQGHWNFTENSLIDVWTENETHVNLNAIMLAKANRLLWQDRCAYYEATWENSTSKIIDCDHISDDRGDRARDIIHPGINTAKEIANKIAKRLKL